MNPKKLLSLLIVLSLAFFVAGCGDKTEDAVTVGGGMGLQELIAKDASGFFVVNIRSAIDGGLYDEVMDDEAKKDVEDFKAKTGIDPKKDIDSAVMVLIGELDMDGGQSEPDFYAVISGKFKKDTIISAIKSGKDANITEEKAEGYNVYFIKKDNETKKDSYMYFHNNDTIIIANTAKAVVTGIKTIEGKIPSIEKNEKMLAAYKKAKKDHMVWGSFIVPMDKAAEAPMPMMAAFSKMEGIYLGGTYKKSKLELDIMLYAPDVNSSKEMTTALTGMLEMIKGFAAEEPAALEVMNNIKISQESDGVSINLTMTKEQMEMMKSMGSPM
ncbi:MAG: hypothetical protein JW737_09610 [Acidobacteria bacterium]|nr:hypothetical protein [Acidobacteriota bacterium]